MSILKCSCCKRFSRNAIGLIVIGDRSYCSKCIKNIRVRKTGKKVKYYTNVGARCFVQANGYIIEEYHVKELRIGNGA
ncbi:hypothetical protein [Clostridium formicaceticum]|uniref:Uncharacterized protein n=1 Tax=Clostridium formicaceticum TaxID=1497 RepID=A0AAC9RK51_9CLOT|nr:hypothetical protein [Clostridium formicaceticum]AOY76670.1 hypothetical protein BJL90_12820 [Clostridium formicaceticum]ARE87099.1 hypothetical protein CLFO_14850 [Clostridium formicaceticum]